MGTATLKVIIAMSAMIGVVELKFKGENRKSKVENRYIVSLPIMARGIAVLYPARNRTCPSAP